MPPAPDRVDILLLAGRGTELERSYALTQLPRLREAGAMEGSWSEGRFRFLERDGWPTVAGQVHGEFVLTCQRCSTPVGIAFDESFEVACAKSEAALDEVSATREAVLADPARLDLRELTEEQLLLALPLVSRHAESQCPAPEPDDAEEERAAADEGREPEEAQRPFANLRDLLSKS